MKVSEKKKTAAYSSISGPIMDLRVDVAKNHRKIDPLELDGHLYTLEIEIWKRLKAALNIEGV